MSTPDAPAPADTCATCLCFRTPAVPAAQARMAERAGVADRPGTCRRFPAMVQKWPSDWCREYEPAKA